VEDVDSNACPEGADMLGNGGKCAQNPDHAPF
jgi:hypothetical protein